MVLPPLREGPPGPTSVGIGPALFALLLLLGAAVGVVGLLWSATVLVGDSFVIQDLVERGIVAKADRVEAVLRDPRPARVGEGCALAEGRLIVFGAAGPVESVALVPDGARREEEVLVVHGSDGEVRCYVGRGAEADAFSSLVVRRAAAPLPPRHQQRVSDPRLLRYYGVPADP